MKGTYITIERNVQWTDTTSEKNVQESGITIERNVQGQTLQANPNQGTVLVYTKPVYCTDV